MVESRAEYSLAVSLFTGWRYITSGEHGNVRRIHDKFIRKDRVASGIKGEQLSNSDATAHRRDGQAATDAEAKHLTKILTCQWVMLAEENLADAGQPANFHCNSNLGKTDTTDATGRRAAKLRVASPARTGH